MKKIFFLKNCNTCKQILDEFDFTGFDLHEIKSTAITKDDLDEMVKLSGDYESLFSKRAQNYKKLDLKNKSLSEEDIKNYILSDYTFLKRPVIVDNNKIFIGSSKKNIEALKEHFTK